MTQTDQRSESRIPEFATREEEAEWFDTHDMADYQDEFKTVAARFAKRLSDGVTIRLDAEAAAKLRAVAKHQHTKAEALALKWVLERLQST